MRHPTPARPTPPTLAPHPRADESPTQRLDCLGHAGAAPLTAGLPPLQSLTLLAAQTDCSEPGELGLFIDESQIGFLDDITRGAGRVCAPVLSGGCRLRRRDRG